jgi:hypothetical protein
VDLLYTNSVNGPFKKKLRSLEVFTYKAVEADPVGVRLVAGGAFHFECVEVGILLSVSGNKSSDAM